MSVLVWLSPFLAFLLPVFLIRAIKAEQGSREEQLHTFLACLSSVIIFLAILCAFLM